MSRGNSGAGLSEAGQGAARILIDGTHLDGHAEHWWYLA